MDGVSFIFYGTDGSGWEKWRRWGDGQRIEKKNYRHFRLSKGFQTKSKVYNFFKKKLRHFKHLPGYEVGL